MGFGFVNCSNLCALLKHIDYRLKDGFICVVAVEDRVLQLYVNVVDTVNTISEYVCRLVKVGGGEESQCFVNDHHFFSKDGL